MIQEAIRKAVEKNDLTRDEARDAMLAIMNGEASDAQIAGFLVAMRIKGETVGEIASFAEVMRGKATRIEAGTADVLDTCGTGGDSAGTFNISTISAFVAAGAGIAVAKHGNRSVSSKCGSADVLREVGVNIDIPPERVSECLQTTGIAFLFAPKLHASMKYAIGPRRELGIRTFFNILGPMTNPALARRQLLGVYSEELVATVAGVLSELGCVRGFVVHGSDGLDEITTTGPTTVAEIRNGAFAVMTVKPGDFGIASARPEDIRVSDIEGNTAVFRDVLAGKKSPARDIVLLNAGFAICAGGKAETPGEGIERARDSIDSGSALAKFESMRNFTNLPVD
jgi:anthranilate phosphoribosyltransferase